MLAQIKTLPQRDQEIIALRYGAGLSNQDIAQIVGKSENHVAVLLYRALKKIRHGVQEEAHVR